MSIQGGFPEGFQLEVCVDRLDDAFVAAEAGASRIEFNQSLAQSGLTPSLGSCESLCRDLSVPVVAMVRPHDVGFVYSHREKAAMLRDCEMVLESGADGIVIGALCDNGQLDIPFLDKVVSLCGGSNVIMHRAFDELEDQFVGLQQLIDAGVARVLTSGGKDKAIQATTKLRQLIERAGEAIEILPGSGVSCSNAIQLIEMTGCNQLHGSFKVPSEIRIRPNSVEIQSVAKKIREFLLREKG